MPADFLQVIYGFPPTGDGNGGANGNPTGAIIALADLQLIGAPAVAFATTSFWMASIPIGTRVGVWVVMTVVGVGVTTDG